MANLAKLKPASEVTFDYLNPFDDRPTGLRVSVMAFEDPRMSMVKRQITDKRLAAERKGKPLKAEELEQQVDEMLFRGTIAWKWEKDADGVQSDWNGEQLPFNRANFDLLLQELPKFREQINEKMGELKGFFQK